MMCVRVNTTFENLLFFSYFFNKDISLNIPCTFLKFGIYIFECQLEGIVPQTFCLGSCFYFMQSFKKS